MSDIKNPTLKAWTAGFVRRWHTHPELCDTVDYDSGHQQRCAVLLLQFWPETSRDLLIRAIIHDQGECDSGDIAYPAKKKHPQIAALVSDIELSSIQSQGFPCPTLSKDDQLKMKFVDYLDSFLWMWRHKPQMMFKSEWENQAVELGVRAMGLGILDEYDDFMVAAHDFFWPQ